MATKVFISWSGELSKKLADAIQRWLPRMLQTVEPYFTPSDVEKGAKWCPDILGELANTNIGIICLTKDNLLEPWILFEAGALSKNMKESLVCTLLFNVKTTDIKGPLTVFQGTCFNEADFKDLIKTINKAGGDSKLEDAALDETFKMWWPKLEEQVAKILEDKKNR